MRGRRGAALILVLWIIVALAAISSGIVRSTRATTGIAVNYRAGVAARYAAESGVTWAVASLEDSLANALTPEARREFLNHLGRAARVPESLGEARMAVALIDVGSRLDLNAADARALTRFFSFFTDPVEAAQAAQAVRSYIGGVRSAIDPALPMGGPEELGLQASRPLASVDELFDVPGLPRALAKAASGFLTVDGDGTINRATASAAVLAAAGGELRDEPSRIVVVSRGWMAGHPLTHEIEAVYAIVGLELTLIHWRERDL